MRLTDNPRRDVPIVIVIVLLLGAIFWPVNTGGGRGAPRSYCLLNVRQQGISAIMYMADADEHFPLRDVWMDALKPYTKGETIFHCPSVPKGVYGYAYHSRLSGAKPPPDPAKTTMLFESVNPIRNASDPLLSLPNPGRHKGSTGATNTLGFADGHAKAMLPEKTR